MAHYLLPMLWVTRLTCPACGTPDALLLFDGVGTVCRECEDTTRIADTDDRRGTR